MFCKIFSMLISVVLTLVFSISCFAVTINLYEQPKADAKVVGKVDLDKSVTIKIIDEQKEWTSIVDPNVAPINARIVWVKTNELPKNNYSFTQTVVNTGKSPQGFVYQYGVPHQLTPEQAAELTKQMKMQQEALQNYFSQVTQSILRSGSQPEMNFPILMPVIVIPEQNKSIPAAQPPGNTKTQK